MKILYFTATGNSLSIAKQIGGELISIPQMMAHGPFEIKDEVIGIVFPVYCCYPPKIVRELLSKVKLEGDYLFAIATYGNNAGTGGDGAAMVEFNKLAKKAGYQFSYLNSILMVDNFIDNFEIGEEIKKIPSKEIDKNIHAIISDIQARKTYIKDPGIAGKAVTTMCKPLVAAQDKGLAAQKFFVTDACVMCGVCAKVCPSGNIVVEGNRPQFKANCLSCYACIHNCPQIAIHKKNEKSAKRWRHPAVSLEELIAANSVKNSEV